MPVLRFVPEQGPRVIVDREVGERRVARRAFRRDFAAVFRVVAPVFLAPLHADGRIGQEMVRVGRARGLRAHRREAGDGILAPLRGVCPDRAFHAVRPVLVRERDLVEVRVARAPRRVQVRNGGVLRLAPRAERGLAVRVVAVVDAAPETEIAVLVADDPAGNRLRVLVARAHVAEEFGVLGARGGRLVPDDVGLPPVGVVDAARVRRRRVHGVPLVREPVRRPLVPDQREDPDVALFAGLHQVVVVGPAPLVVPVLLDVLPDKVGSDRVAAHLDDLVQVVVNLVVRLPDPQRPVPRLVRDAVRNPCVRGRRIVEIAVRHLDERRQHGGRRAGQPEEHAQHGENDHHAAIHADLLWVRRKRGGKTTCNHAKSDLRKKRRELRSAFRRLVLPPPGMTHAQVLRSI